NFTRSQFLPDVSQRLKKNDGIDSFFYGNFSRDRKRWETYPPLPRYGIVHTGLRNRIGILCESYTYASFKERVRGSRGFVGHCLDSIVANKGRIRTILREARETTINAGKKPRADDQITLRFTAAPFKEPATIRGFVEERKDGRTVPTDKPHDYEVEF